MIPASMPSPIGHALAGLATAWALAPETDLVGPTTSSALKNRLVLACAGLAALPDIDLVLPFRHRTVTHSVGAVIVVMIIAAIVTGRVTRRRVAPTVTLCGAAYATHLLLDWLAADRFFPYGLQALWPFSDRFFISGWDIFAQTERLRLLSGPVLRQNGAAIAGELAILGPIVLAIWLIRVKPAARLAAEVARRHHAAK
jgi:inner membrane protein